MGDRLNSLNALAAGVSDVTQGLASMFDIDAKRRATDAALDINASIDDWWKNTTMTVGTFEGLSWDKLVDDYTSKIADPTNKQSAIGRALANASSDRERQYIEEIASKVIDKAAVAKFAVTTGREMAAKSEEAAAQMFIQSGNINGLNTLYDNSKLFNTEAERQYFKAQAVDALESTAAVKWITATGLSAEDMQKRYEQFESTGKTDEGVILETTQAKKTTAGERVADKSKVLKIAQDVISTKRQTDALAGRWADNDALKDVIGISASLKDQNGRWLPSSIGTLKAKRDEIIANKDQWHDAQAYESAIQMLTNTERAINGETPTEEAKRYSEWAETAARRSALLGRGFKVNASGDGVEETDTTLRSQADYESWAMKNLAGYWVGDQSTQFRGYWETDEPTKTAVREFVSKYDVLAKPDPVKKTALMTEDQANLAKNRFLNDIRFLPRTNGAISYNDLSRIYSVSLGAAALGGAGGSSKPTLGAEIPQSDLLKMSAVFNFAFGKEMKDEALKLAGADEEKVRASMGQFVQYASSAIGAAAMSADGVTVSAASPRMSNTNSDEAVFDVMTKNEATGKSSAIGIAVVQANPKSGSPPVVTIKYNDGKITQMTIGDAMAKYRGALAEKEQLKENDPAKLPEYVKETLSEVYAGQTVSLVNGMYEVSRIVKGKKVVDAKLSPDELAETVLSNMATGKHSTIATKKKAADIVGLLPK
jgi:hypothetical protein